MKKVWNAENGFGERVGSYIYGGIVYLRVKWDRSPWFTDDIPESEVEYCE